MNNFQSQGKKISHTHINTLLNSVEKSFSLSNQTKPVVLIFWATWCAPCELELNRINNWLSKNPQFINNIVAISSFETEDVIRKISVQRQYKFPIASDITGELSKSFQIQGTPTIILIDTKGYITWRTTGISPTLEFRLYSFLTNSNSQ
ncbi:MAG: redoxin domain-containing protein [Bdellovibrionaceae bacterium]|nr:redoxin domain-containing protein [Pseudobdellovibrionaceae bacterium]